MSASEGFTVNLESLTAFSEELTTQLSGMSQPLGHLNTLTGGDIHLGKFPEADSLWQNHDTAVDQMSALVGQARDAIDFAEEITKSVHTAYEHFDDGVNAAINTVGGVVETVGSAVGDTVGSITDTIGDTVESTTGMVAPIVSGTVGPVVSGVDGVVGGIVDALTGGGGDLGSAEMPTAAAEASGDAPDPAPTGASPDAADAGPLDKRKA